MFSVKVPAFKDTCNLGTLLSGFRDVLNRQGPLYFMNFESSLVFRIHHCRYVTRFYPICAFDQTHCSFIQLDISAAVDQSLSTFCKYSSPARFIKGTLHTRYTLCIIHTRSRVCCHSIHTWLFIGC